MRRDEDIQYVTSVPPTEFADLLAIPLEQMREVAADRHPGLAGYRTWSCERKVWSKRLQMVMRHSPELAKGQLRGVLQHRDKAVRRLRDLQDRLARRTATSKGRKPTVQSVTKQVDDILSAQHMRRLVGVEVYVEEGDLVRLRHTLDQEHLEHLQQHLFGRRIWLTTRPPSGCRLLCRPAQPRRPAGRLSARHRHQPGRLPRVPHLRHGHGLPERCRCSNPGWRMGS
jgi:hypothetical protein